MYVVLKEIIGVPNLMYLIMVFHNKIIINYPNILQLLED